MQVPVPVNDNDESAGAVPPRGAAARTRALMVATATEMMRRGLSPSVSEVAEAAGVSRSTAYRYFPTLADMLRAVVAEALGPILNWQGGDQDARGRLAELYATAFPRISEHEATFRAALRQSIEPNAEKPGDVTLGRGHRRDLLARAVGSLHLPPVQATRLVQALSLTFGIEALIVLKDICGLSDRDAQDVALWAAGALLDAARHEAGSAEA
ncbi:MAG: TetR/AcrR family transcriptional regulator [Rhodobacteraceae bacterium]|nr:TetR/AcrR family transcriptional regulator [Paracoccaceae bacterium]